MLKLCLCNFYFQQITVPKGTGSEVPNTGITCCSMGEFCYVLRCELR